LSKDDLEDLKQFVTNHKDLTGSEVARSILGAWDEEREKFIKVMPTDYKRVLNEMKERKKASNG
jgi:glutamate synthase domain-containing protein 3